jgi:hypothetical protein
MPAEINRDRRRQWSSTKNSAGLINRPNPEGQDRSADERYSTVTARSSIRVAARDKRGEGDS